jgi:hypothetical protein
VLDAAVTKIPSRSLPEFTFRSAVVLPPPFDSF